MSYAIPAIRNIRLSGELGKKFGRLHRFAVGSAAEAIRALCANFPAFKSELLSSDERGVGYRVIVGDRDIGLDEVSFPIGQSDIRIVPVIRGAKNGGVWQLVAGVALIAAVVIAQQYELLPAAYASQIVSVGVGIGLSLALGGISQLLAPSQKKDQSKNAASYTFGGPVNTADQGLPVPFGYGEMIVGSAVISAGLVVDQVPTTETGPANLAAIVTQSIGTGGAASYLMAVTWQAAGQAVGYDVMIQGPGYGPTTQPRTNATSLYVTVPGPGPFTAVCNPVEPDGSYGPNSTCVSSYVPAS
jgi:predicted phage tail protein